MKRLNSFFFIVALCAALFFLQQRLWVSRGSIQEMQRLNQMLSAQSAKVNDLKKQNAELMEEVIRLQNSQEAIEARARSELGMVKKDETFYQIVK